MRTQGTQESLFEALISGERAGVRQIVQETLESGLEVEALIEEIFWPVLEQVDHLYRHDQMTEVSYQFATRLMRMVVDQLQLRLEQSETNGERVLLACGRNEAGELAGQIASDLLEAQGYEVFFAGGGVPRDEIIAQIGQIQPGRLVLFGSTPSDLPYIRQTIDQLHEIGASPNLQVIVGGGVFNRAEGLAEEIGADLWARTPVQLIRVMREGNARRASADQRTVGRSLRTPRAHNAA